jgi:hypothetical protein
MSGSFLVSPGVALKEQDLTNVIPTLASSPAATCGDFDWGPVMDPITVDTENNLVRYFGSPSATSANAFFTAANFLAYSGNIMVNRAYSTWMFNANNAVADSVGAGTISVTIGTKNVSGISTAFDSTFVGKYLLTQTGTVVGQISEVTDSTNVVLVANAKQTFSDVNFNVGIRSLIKNKSDYEDGGLSFTSFGGFVAKYPGAIGSSLSVSIVDSATWLKVGAGTISVTSGSKAVTGGGSPDFVTNLVVGSYLVVAGEVIGQISTIDSATTLTLVSGATKTVSASAYSVKWQYADLFDYAPEESTFGASLNATSDELHIVVVDENGLFSGQVGTVLEVYKGVSKASDAKKPDGTKNYYKSVINDNSQYVYWANHPTGTTNWGTSASGKSFNTLSKINHVSLSNGSNGIGVDIGDMKSAYQMFQNDMLYDVALIPVGKANYELANYVIQNIAEVRKDCVVFVSPENTVTGDPIIGTTSTQADLIKTYADLITSSSYGIIDSGYKYQYDIYNDVYRWIPLNGDIAGLAARTDSTNDPWWSPAGFNRGQIKNIVKLAFNPGQTDRDTLYKARVNPVVQFPGQGVVLYGDKTALSRPSAFDRINVRRLFIILEKAIATAAKYQLFEFNDQFTRGRFRAMIEPFLRDVQGRRGIQQYQIICDSSNNTSQIISTNQFVADIKIMPTYSINFITLNFVATNNSASFTETGG